MRNELFKRAATALFTLSLLPAIALAQSIRPTYQYPVPPVEGPTSVQVGGSPFYFTPYIGLAAGYDDNLFLTRNVTRSSPLYVVSPGFKIDSRSSKTVLQLGYQAQIGRYTDSRNDDYEDQNLRAQFDVAFDRRNFLRVGGDVVYGHDPRGSTDRAISQNPDKYRVAGWNTTYAFGAPGAVGRVEAYYSDNDRKYRNNRATTALGDRGTQEFGGAFYVRLAPKTYAVVEGRETRIKYDQPSPNDAKERRYYGGIAWDATATTTGVVKVGRFQRDFQSNVPDFSDIGWEASLAWTPRTYSRFDLYTSRYSTESSGLGNFIVTDATGLSWSHQWSAVVSTAVDVKYIRDDYQGVSRKDDTMSLGLKMGYKFRRWLTFGAEYTFTKRNSTVDSADYEKNLYFLTATASM